MASNRSTARRLDELERKFALNDGPSPSRQEVLFDRIDRGIARLYEFEEFLDYQIDAYRSMLITRSVYYGLCRFKGWEPWAWRPQHVAASILAVPLGQPIPDYLTARVTWMVDQPLRRPTGKRQADRMLSKPELHRLWVQHQLCAIALGTADALQLRTEMADGVWAGAIEYTMRHPQLAEEAIVNVPSCRRWYELPDDFARAVPFDMTEDEARAAHPPWDQFKQRDWWPPPKYSLEARLELARRTSPKRLAIDELVRLDEEHGAINHSDIEIGEDHSQ